MTLEELFHLRGWTEIPGPLETPCWEWRGSRDKNNYGRIRQVFSHRVAFEMWIRPLDPDEVVRHRCDNPPCMNPLHLEPGTHADNIRDREDRGRGVRLPGELSPNAKLTSKDVLDIRREYGYGVLTQRMLGEVYGVDNMNISRIVRRETWKHI